MPEKKVYEVLVRRTNVIHRMEEKTFFILASDAEMVREQMPKRLRDECRNAEWNDSIDGWSVVDDYLIDNVKELKTVADLAVLDLDDIGKIV